MNSDKITKLENSIKLKKKIFGKNIWKNYAIVPPAIVMFGGILGIIYLYNIDKLISLHAIPFVFIFVLGTVWLKSVRKYIIDKKIENSSDFLLCLSISLLKEGGKTIILFSTGKNRNNKYYLEKEKKNILDQENTNKELLEVDNKPKQIGTTDIYIVQLPFSKKFSDKIENGHWIIFTGSNSIEFITRQELKKYA